MRRNRHILISLFIICGFSAAYRFCTVTTEATITAITLSPSGHTRLQTDQGGFRNDPNPFFGKTRAAAEAIDMLLHKDNLYSIENYGGWFGLSPNILNLAVLKDNRPPEKMQVVDFQPIEQAPPASPPPRKIDNGEGPGYALTENEAALAKRIFGEKLDTANIRLHFFKERKTELYSTTLLKFNEQKVESAVIGFYGTEYLSEDYAHADLNRFAYFLHEMTHIWQAQTLMKLTKSYNPHRYHYTLTGNHPFWRYDNEQQAAMIEDYARRFLHAEKGKTIYYMNAQNLFGQLGYDTKETDKLLKQVVEQQFPQ